MLVLHIQKKKLKKFQITGEMVSKTGTIGIRTQSMGDSENCSFLKFFACNMDQRPSFSSKHKVGYLRIVC